MEDRPKNTEKDDRGEADKEPKGNFLETWMKFLRGSKGENQENDADFSNEVPGEPDTGRSEPERVGDIARRIESGGVSKLAASEFFNQDQDREIKKEAKSLKKEQAELYEQRLAFEKQLDKKLKREKNKNPFAQSDATERGRPESEENEALDPRELQEILKTAPSTRPEVIMEQVEAAAEHDLAIESLYERRHELKDSSEDDHLASGAKLSEELGGEGERSQKNTIEEAVSNTPPNIASLKSGHKRSRAQSGLYRQAVISGFWTAVLLLGVIFILILLS